MRNKKLIIDEFGFWNYATRLSKKIKSFIKKNSISPSCSTKGKSFKVEIRKTCKMCPKKLGYRQRTFCSPTCRNKSNYQKRKVYQAKYQREKFDRLASESSDKKCQCLICGRWYVQVGTHIVQKHGMTAREYREHFDLEVKSGITPPWYKKVKGDLALGNGTFKNLEKGEKFWFKKGDSRAGKYHRSHITMERLKVLHKLNKHNKIK